MTYPRYHTVDPDQPGIYHCTSRCVRRAWLCGQDDLTGRSFEHRKAWIEDRIIELTEVYAITVSSYAVMSNHYHVVVRVDPGLVHSWSDEQVAERWLKLSKPIPHEKHVARVAAIVSDTERLAVLRKRLGSLSWYMKSINEPIARRSNREDGCKGRFWEGRFFSEVLLDEGAVAAAMAYVDLNPVRAKMVAAPELAEYTSLARRKLKGRRIEAGITDLSVHNMNLKGYLTLLRWTLDSRDDNGVARNSATNMVFPCSPADWIYRYQSHRSSARARGCRRTLRDFATKLGQRWVWGLGNAPST